MEVDRRYEVNDGEVKASPLSFPLRSNLLCGGNSEKLIFVDQEDGRVSEVNIAGGVARLKNISGKRVPDRTITGIVVPGVER